MMTDQHQWELIEEVRHDIQHTLDRRFESDPTIGDLSADLAHAAAIAAENFLLDRFTWDDRERAEVFLGLRTWEDYRERVQ